MDLPDGVTGPVESDRPSQMVIREEDAIDSSRVSAPPERSLAENVSGMKLCGVCNEKEGKYKCTRCYLP